MAVLSKSGSPDRIIGSDHRIGSSNRIIRADHRIGSVGYKIKKYVNTEKIKIRLKQGEETMQKWCKNEIIKRPKNTTIVLIVILHLLPYLFD